MSKSRKKSNRNHHLKKSKQGTAKKSSRRKAQAASRQDFEKDSLRAFNTSWGQKLPWSTIPTIMTPVDKP